MVTKSNPNLFRHTKRTFKSRVLMLSSTRQVSTRKARSIVWSLIYIVRLNWIMPSIQSFMMLICWSLEYRNIFWPLINSTPLIRTIGRSLKGFTMWHFWVCPCISAKIISCHVLKIGPIWLLLTMKRGKIRSHQVWSTIQFLKSNQTQELCSLLRSGFKQIIIFRAMSYSAQVIVCCQLPMLSDKVKSIRK